MRALTLGGILGVFVLASTSVGGDLGAQQLLISPDSQVTVTLPESYFPMTLNPAASLQFADSTADAYFMTFLEAKQDLYGWNLTRHGTITIAQILVGLDFPEVVGPVDMRIGGFPAHQREVRGVMQGTRIAYLHTTVELPAAFVQVLTWTTSSRWDGNQATLRDIVDSMEFPQMGEDPVPADVFSIVPGTWAREGSEDGCSSDTQTFEIAEDRQSSPLQLHTYIPDETRETDDGVPVKWDLVVVARNRMAWHRTDWAEGGLTEGMERCAPESE